MLCAAIAAAGDLFLPLVVRVPLDQRGILRGMPGTDHRVLERGAGSGRERVPGVVKVVEPGALRHADDAPRQWRYGWWHAMGPVGGP